MPYRSCFIVCRQMLIGCVILYGLKLRHIRGINKEFITLGRALQTIELSTFDL